MIRLTRGSVWWVAIHTGPDAAQAMRDYGMLRHPVHPRVHGAAWVRRWAESRWPGREIRVEGEAEAMPRMGLW